MCRPFTSADVSAVGFGIINYSGGITSGTYGNPDIQVQNNATQAAFHKASGSQFQTSDMNMSSGTLYITFMYEA